MRRYSRLNRLEESKNKRTAFVFGGLTLLLIIFLIFFGVPTIAKFGAFIADIKNSEEPVEILDKTPPAPPQIDQPPEFTNKLSIQMTGSAEPGSTVTFFLNNKQKETVVGEDGQFSIPFPLNKGENKVYATARDKAGNESTSSKVYTITFDNKISELTVLEPVTGAIFTGKSEQSIVVKGIVDTGATVTVNSRLAVVDPQGNFSANIILTEGSNSIEIKAEDEAQNQFQKTITVTYIP